MKKQVEQAEDDGKCQLWLRKGTAEVVYTGAEEGNKRLGEEIEYGMKSSCWRNK